MRVLVSGSTGPIGSEAVLHFDAAGCRVDGIDLAAVEHGRRLREHAHRFRAHDLDLRDRRAVEFLFKASRFDLVIHCPRPPSRERAARSPADAFDSAAVGTLNLLESVRRCSADAVFIFVSSSRVYGDAPNRRPLVEQETRFDFADPADYEGIAESCPIDHCRRGLAGAALAAADLLVQEYGRSFGLRTGVLRVGSVAAAPGFLAQLADAAYSGRPFALHAGGKQVRDPIHPADVVAAIDAYYEAPQSGEVFNLGGGRDNSVSVLEAIGMIEEIAGAAVEIAPASHTRRGEPVCYISDTAKFRRQFPRWRITRAVPQMLDQMLAVACI